MSTRQTVVKRVEFPAGHRLLHYDGKCKYIHGHNFVAEVCVGADQLDRSGFVVDFTHLGRYLKRWIDDKWDHAFIAHKDDKKVIRFIKQMKMKLYVMKTNPSSENMARELFFTVASWFPDHIVEYVNIWESSMSYAQYNLDRSKIEGSL